MTSSPWAAALITLVAALIAVGGTLMGVAISQYFESRRFDRQVSEARRHSDIEYAAAWKAVLVELWHALERMKYTTECLLSTPPITPYFTINLTEGLNLAYQLRSRDTEIAGKVYGIYNEVQHFKQKLDGLVGLVFDPAVPPSGTRPYEDLNRALRFLGQSRHWGMVREYNTCRARYEVFCRDAELGEGFALNLAALSTIPRHQWRDESGRPVPNDA